MTRTVGTLAADRTAVRGVVLAEEGAPVRGATITVTDAATGNAASLFADAALSTPLSSVVADANGVYQFFVADGTYYLAASGLARMQSIEPVTVSTGLGSGGTAAAPVSSISSAASSAQRLLLKLSRNISDASIMVVSDSTAASTPSAESARWPYQVVAGLGARFPTYSVEYYKWNDTNQTYDAAVVIQVGTGTANAGGPFTLRMYNFSVGGKSTDYALGSMDVGLTPIQPDLVFVSHGHNEQAGFTPLIASRQYKGEMLGLTETITQLSPGSSLIIVAQNPNPVDTSLVDKANEYATVALVRGYGYINVLQAFLDYGTSWPTDLMTTPTDKHPNAVGQTLWANEVLAAMTYTREAPFKSQPPSAFVDAGEPLNYNGDFSVWTGAVPDGYRLSGCTASKDFVNYENELTGYGCRLLATGAAPSYIELRLPVKTGTRLRNRRITIAVRMFIPSAVTSTAAGSVQVSTTIGSAGSPTVLPSVQVARSDTIRHGMFVWKVLVASVDALASFIQVRIYADTGNQAAADLTIDRVLVVPGIVPVGRPSLRQTALPVIAAADPTAIPSQAYSWEANDLVGTGLNQNDPITQLTDKSGNARHATQATSGKRATYDPATALNSKPTAKFVSANSQQYAIAYSQPSKITQYVVYTARTGDPGGSFIGNDGVGTFAQQQENTLLHLGRNPANRTLTFPTTRTLNEAGGHLLVMRYDYDGGVYDAWLDGELVGARDPTQTVLNPAGTFLLGSWRLSSNFLDANVAAIFIADRIHTDPERRGVQDMLATRYGLTLVSRV